MGSMEEPAIVVSHREQLAYLLAEAAEIEHGLMCCYLYAAFSLKQGEDEDLLPHELEAVRRWRSTILDVARQEMFHLAIVANLSTAVGIGAHFYRPNLPVDPGLYPSGVILRLTPFDAATMDHFVFLERPEGTELPDGEGFREDEYERAADDDRRLTPSAHDYRTVGHLYRAIRDGLRELARDLGEETLFCGDPAGQVDATMFHGLDPILDLEGAEAAIDHIVAEGEGTAHSTENSHYCRFLAIRDELAELTARRPGFVPARPVPHDPVMNRPLPDCERVHVDDPLAARVLDLGNAVYGLLVRLLGRMFGPVSGTSDERRDLAGQAIELMHAVSAISDVLTRMPASADHPGVTAGLSFTFSRSLDPLPQHAAAWQVLRERAHEIAVSAGRTAALVPDLAPVAAQLARVSGRLAVEATRAVTPG